MGKDTQPYQERQPTWDGTLVKWAVYATAKATQLL